MVVSTQAPQAHQDPRSSTKMHIQTTSSPMKPNERLHRKNPQRNLQTEHYRNPQHPTPTKTRNQTPSFEPKPKPYETQLPSESLKPPNYAATSSPINPKPPNPKALNPRSHSLSTRRQVAQRRRPRQQGGCPRSGGPVTVSA